MSNEQTLDGLIADRKGSRSYDKMSQDCGDVPTSNRLHQLANVAPKNVLAPDTIRGLAKGLDLPVLTGNDPTALSIGGAGTLPNTTKGILTTVAREFFKLASERQDARTTHGHDTKQEPRPQMGSMVVSSASSTPRSPGSLVAPYVSGLSESTGL